MTVEQAVKLVLPEGATFDYALPQTWMDRTTERLMTLDKHRGKERYEVYRLAYGHFVWAYDEPHGVFGRPCALTTTGNEVLRDLRRFGEEWPLTENPVTHEDNNL